MNNLFIHNNIHNNIHNIIIYVLKCKSTTECFFVITNPNHVPSFHQSASMSESLSPSLPPHFCSPHFCPHLVQFLYSLNPWILIIWIFAACLSHPWRRVQWIAKVADHSAGSKTDSAANPICWKPGTFQNLLPPMYADLTADEISQQSGGRHVAINYEICHVNFIHVFLETINHDDSWPRFV